MHWPQKVLFLEWPPVQFLGTDSWGWSWMGEGGATHVHTEVHTFQKEEKAGRALRRTLSSHEEEEEEPAESGGC